MGPKWASKAPRFTEMGLAAPTAPAVSLRERVLVWMVRLSHGPVPFGGLGSFNPFWVKVTPGSK